VTSHSHQSEVATLKPIEKIVGVKPLLRKLLLQIDNCVKDNKNCHMLAFLSLLIVWEVFEKVQLGFFVVGHTHEDIDESFGYLSKKLRKQNNYVMADLIHAFPRLSIHSTIHLKNP
jgi:hypothetical protein